jgi:hypothetical protein
VFIPRPQNSASTTISIAGLTAAFAAAQSPPSRNLFDLRLRSPILGEIRLRSVICALFAIVACAQSERNAAGCADAWGFPGVIWTGS